MNKIILMAALVVSTAVHAGVPTKKVFRASLCSELDGGTIRPSVIAVERVCLGKWKSKDAVRLFINDGTERTYAIEMEKYQARMGRNPYKFSGTMVIPKNMEDTIEGVYVYTTGMTVSHSISLDTDSNLKFNGPIYPVYTRQ